MNGKNEKLKSAIYEAVLPRVLGELPPEPTGLSPKAEKRIERQIRRRRSRLYPLISTAGRRAAVIVLCAVVGLSALTVSAAAVFPESFGIALKSIGGYFGIGVGNEPETQQSFGSVSVPEYIPEGFEAVLIESSETSVYILYVDQEGGAVAYSQSQVEDASLMVDAKLKPSQTKVGGRDAVLFSGYGRVLIWSNGGNILRLEDSGGILSEEELMRIAESVER